MRRVKESINMESINGNLVEIITGQYQKASPEEKELINSLFGENAAYDFEIYFHWYNILHELGHAVLSFHSKAELHPADEEQLVNDFAFAYWQQFGEPEKVNTLCNIVERTLVKFIAPANLNYLEYAKKQWGTEEMNTFQNYGWFQFSCVQNSISRRLDLEQVLLEMGIEKVPPQTKEILSYHVDEQMPFQVLNDAVQTFHNLGIAFPENAKIVLSDDPNRHCCNIYPISPGTAE